MKVLFVFPDGVGIGSADPGRNPFLTADLPALRGLLGTVPTLEEPRIEVGHLPPDALPFGADASIPAEEEGTGLGVGRGGSFRPLRDARGKKPRSEAVAFPLDATLGVEGVPRSGTGHTALLTGTNAPAMFGRHFGPWVPVRLRSLLKEENVLRRARERGRSAAFANAYPRGWPGDGSSLRRVAGAPLAARGAGLLTRHVEALEREEAVASEIVNDGWRESLAHDHLPTPTPTRAGRTLARIASGADLTLFAHYTTDLVGHRGERDEVVAALERMDAFLGAVLEHLPAHTLLLVASDHGNVEELDGGHTRNPALGLLVGPDAVARATELRSITDVAPAVLEWLAE